MVLFVSDLDNTLIYSYKREIGKKKICVALVFGFRALLARLD